MIVLLKTLFVNCKIISQIDKFNKKYLRVNLNKPNKIIFIL